MSKFRQLVLESLVELQEAPRKKPGYYVRADNPAMQRYSGKHFYFKRFEMEKNGREKPLFLDAEYRDLATTFKTPEEAEAVIKKIYSEAPIYERLFGSISVSPTNTDSLEDTPEQPQPQSQEQSSSKFKDWLKQQKGTLSNIFKTAKNTLNAATDKTAKLLKK